MTEEGEELLFRDSDFEQETFDDAEFVSKYRRVVTLESLREQLVSYNTSVRKELYAIINRDYKDFITIATKLDGLDTRLELIQKPLFDLQINISSLHNVITTNLRTFKEKAQQKSSVANKKCKLEQLVLAIDNLIIVQQALQLLKSPQVNHETLYEKSDFYRQGLLKTLPSTENCLDLFYCSEYERTSSALSISLNSLAGIEMSKASTDLGVMIPAKEFAEEVMRLKNTLEDKMTAHLEMSFADFSKAPPSFYVPFAEEPQITPLPMDLRCLLHCVRGLMFLNSERLVERAFVRAVIEPFIKANMTFGKIDGKEGRGSFSGLEETLTLLVDLLRKTRLVEILILLEDASRTMLFSREDAKVDLLVNAVWSPIAQVLMERFANIFSIGITSIFAKCFLAIHRFIRLLSASLDREQDGPVLQRLLRSESYQRPAQLWKLDTYSQLRFREVTQRLDRLCDISLQTALTSSSLSIKSSSVNPVRSLMDQLYPMSSLHSAGTASAASSSSLLASGSNNPLQMDPLQLSTLREAYQDFLKQSQSPLFNDIIAAFVLELLVVVNRSVALPPLFGKFLLVVDRVVQRLALHVCLVVVSDSSCSLCQQLFKLSRAEVDALRLSLIQKKTEAKSSAIEVSVKTATTPDEQIIICNDTLLFARWFTTQYVGYIEKNIPDLLSPRRGDSDNWSSIISKTVQESAKILFFILRSTLRQVVQDLLAECAKAFSHVKAIAGKYRMTNKPAPSTASSYVNSIFVPFKKVLEAYSDQLNSLLKESRFLTVGQLEADADLTVESPPGTNMVSLFDVKEFVVEYLSNVFHEQVVSLLGTVKQMDSALQRRAIKGRSLLPSDSGSNLSDSEKIALQLRLDVASYDGEIRSLGFQDLTKLCNFQKLLQETQNTDFSK